MLSRTADMTNSLAIFRSYYGLVEPVSLACTSITRHQSGARIRSTDGALSLHCALLTSPRSITSFGSTSYKHNTYTKPVIVTKLHALPSANAGRLDVFLIQSYHKDYHEHKHRDRCSGEDLCRQYGVRRPNVQRQEAALKRPDIITL